MGNLIRPDSGFKMDLPIESEPLIPMEGYIINMKDRPERWERAQKIFENVKSIHLNRVDGIKSEVCPPSGCTQSHMSIIRMAKEKGLPYVLVLEDDCLIMDPKNFDLRFSQIINWLDSHLDDWEIFNVAPTYVEKKYIQEVVSKELSLVKVNFGYTTHMIIYNAKSYDFILNHDINLPIDVIVSRNFKQLTSVPFLAIQYDSYSDLQKTVMNYGGIFAWSQHQILEYLKTV